MNKIYLTVLFLLALQVATAQDTSPNWKITGNSDVKGPNFLGTTNNSDLVFKTNKIEWGRLTGAGVWRFGPGPGINYIKIDAAGKLTVGAYTFPLPDGTIGQVLKTNGAGLLSWSSDVNNIYTAGTGISIVGNVIGNTGDLTGTDDANLFLSNLSSPTAISQSLLPGTTNAIDFGSGGLSWKDVYANGAIYLNGAKFLWNPGGQNVALGPGALTSITSGTLNTAIGNSALQNNTTGGANTATGDLALFANTTGNSNAAHGFGALLGNTAGSFNAAHGYRALNANTTGSNNTATGAFALVANTTGHSNAAHGYKALFENITGSNNTATGVFALSENTTGNANSAHGFGALLANTTGSNNTATGDFALSGNSTGNNNTATGLSSLNKNTTGGNNTANGYRSLFGNTTGPENTAIGYQSLFSNTTGGYNTATGARSLHSNTIGSGNAAGGYEALFANTTGTSNTASGHSTLRSNTTGDFNTAMGATSLYSNTTGIGNVAHGYQALFANTTGGSNTASGYGALFNNSSGNQNTATGTKSLYSNSTGGNNAAHGVFALFSNTTGNDNAAHGYSALYYNTIGKGNAAHGFGALYSNTTGEENTGIGDKALFSNTSGINNTATGGISLYSNTTGASNSAQGYAALYSNTTGDFNAAHGQQALYSNTTGIQNTASGPAALHYNTTGNYNAAHGVFALLTNKTGSNNTAIGFGADVAIDDLTNASAIGNGAIVDASDMVRIGNTSVTSIGGEVGWTTFSDGRYKRNIKENVKGLAFINSLRPVTYTVDINSLNNYFNRGKKPVSGKSDMKAGQGNLKPSITDLKENESLKKSANEASRIIQTGFVAQEVEAAAEKLHYDFSGVDKPKNKDGIYGLRYDQFVVPLVKAVQELSKLNNDREAKIVAQQKRIDDLETKLNRFEAMLSQCCTSPNVQTPSSQTIVLDDADASALQQNVPNPFNRSTTINYTLPNKFSSAQIIITDKNGKALKQVRVEGSGKGMLQVNASTLASGAYSYTLYVDGKLIGSRQMLLAK